MSGPLGDRGSCAACRHANHGTQDAGEGLWACPWLGPTSPESPCRIRYRDTGRYVFEAYDGTNGTWGTGDPQFRAVPAGYEGHAVVNEAGAAVGTPPSLDPTLGDGS